MKKIILMLTVLIILTLVPTCGVMAKNKAKLNKTKATMYEDTTIQLKVKNYKKKIKWKSSNKKVASVSKSGKVFANKSGKATITAKVNNKKLKCKIKIKKRKVIKLKNVADAKEISVKPSVKVIYKFKFTPSTSGLYYIQSKSNGGKYYFEYSYESNAPDANFSTDIDRIWTAKSKWCHQSYSGIFAKGREYVFKVQFNKIKKKGKKSVFRFIKSNEKITPISLDQTVNVGDDEISPEAFSIDNYYSFTANESGYYKIEGNADVYKPDSDTYVGFEMESARTSHSFEFKTGVIPKQDEENTFYVSKGETAIINAYYYARKINMNFKIIKQK